MQARAPSTRHKTGIVVAACLGTGILALVACSDSDKPPAGSPGQSNASSSSGAVSSGTDAQADDAADARNEASAPTCHAIPNDAPASTIELSSEEGPPPFVGGKIAEGTYFLTREVRYQESPMPAISAPGITLTISGNEMKYGAYTAENEYVPIAAMFRIEAVNVSGADGGDVADAGDPSEAGPDARIVITQTCPHGGSSLGPQPYSVVGDELTIGFGLFTVTYTKQ